MNRPVFNPAERRGAQIRLLRHFIGLCDEMQGDEMQGDAQWEELTARTLWLGIVTGQSSVCDRLALFNADQLARFQVGHPALVARAILTEVMHKPGPAPEPPTSARLLAFIKDHVAVHGTNPTVAQMRQGVGDWPRPLIYRFLHILIVEGKIEQCDGFDHPRSPSPGPLPRRANLSMLVFMTGMDRRLLVTRALVEGWPKKWNGGRHAQYDVAQLPGDIQTAVSAHLTAQARARVGLPPITEVAG